MCGLCCTMDVDADDDDGEEDDSEGDDDAAANDDEEGNDDDGDDDDGDDGTHIVVNPGTRRMAKSGFRWCRQRAEYLVK